MVTSPIPFHRLTAAITSWFRLPGQGMKRYDMLCRGTAFCVQAPDSAVLYFFTCSHVAAPWRWPKLYPLPWLQHVTEENVRCVLHVTETGSGRVIERLEMAEQVTHHGELDACLLTVKDQEAAIKLFERHGLPLVPLVIDKTPLVQGQAIVCPGYGVDKARGAASSSPLSTNSEGSSSSQVMSLSPGVDLDLQTDSDPRQLTVTPGIATRFHDGQSRSFVVMDKPLADGVCGAPVVDLASGKCVGLMEGVVPERIPQLDPESEVHKTIAGSAAVIHGRELTDLLDEAALAREEAPSF